MTRTDYRSIFIDRRLSPFLRESHEHVLQAANLKANTRILVVECRDGWAAEEAYRRVARGYVCGVDVSHAMLTLARQYREVQDHLEFLSWDRERLSLPDDSFDTALVPFTIHRLPDPGAALGEIARVVRPGGRLLILEPTRHAFSGLYIVMDWFSRRFDPGHVRYYTAKELIQMVEAGGFAKPRVTNRFAKFRSGGKVLANATLFESRVAQLNGGTAS